MGLMAINKKYFDKLKLLEIASDLELYLKKIVDIGIISSENLVYSKEAIINGKCIYCSDKIRKDSIETTLLSMYINSSKRKK